MAVGFALWLVPGSPNTIIATNPPTASEQQTAIGVPPDACTNYPGIKAVPDKMHREADGRCVADAPAVQDALAPTPVVCPDVILGQPQSDEAIAKCLDESTRGWLRGVWAFLQIFRWPLVAGILAAFITILVTPKVDREFSKAFLAFFGAAIAVFVLGSTLWGLITGFFVKIGFAEGWPALWVVPVDKMGNPFEFAIIGGAIVLSIGFVASLTWYKRFGQAVAAGIVAAMLWGSASTLPGNNLVKWTNHAVEKVFYPHAGEGLSQVDALLAAQQAEDARLKVIKSR
ncbi:MAG TPA: hypothetical protein VHD37_03015 [Candidatus Paceibacterota bacterium]|nr:hypothetical protein [Candidatus Paceibacterota bacterium]